jgi:hypothetical protein
MSTVADEILLQQAAETVTLLALRADQLSVNEMSRQLFDQLEGAITILRRTFARRIAVECSQKT